MNKLINYKPTFFLLFLILGILLQFYFKVLGFNYTTLTVFLVLIILLFFLLSKPKFKFVYSFLTFIIFICIGSFSVIIQNPKSYTNYYENHYTKNNFTTLEIQKILKSGNYYNKYIAKVLKINNKTTQGKTLLNIKKSDNKSLIKIGEQIVLFPEFKELIPPLNPHQFNYKEYLEKQHIYHQVFANENDYKTISYTESFFNSIASFRRKIQLKLKESNFTANQYSVINALLLGQRQEISKELLKDYTNAGAIHILAISGLHIGILLLILNRLFKPLHKFKHGKTIAIIMTIVLLWLFAILAGLSASVVRAVTMFTFITIGLYLKEKQPTEHSLITSMFVLLLVNPMFLFDVGFQLSYLAVFGIVWFQPLIYNLFSFKIIFLDKIWQLFTVSIAAQIGILPLSLYYFHQFPALFIFSNLLIIPFLGGILLGGIIIILLSTFNILPNFIAEVYGWIISLMNKTVNFIASKEDYILKEISMSFLEMLLWYCVIISFYILLKSIKPKFIYATLISVLSLQIILIFETTNRNTKEEFIVFHKSRKAFIGNRKGNILTVFKHKDTLITNEKAITSYKIKENVKTVYNTNIPNIFIFKSDTILIIDSLGVYNNLPLKEPIIVFQNSPKINLDRLFTSMNPKKIIADGSNYKSYINRWNITCIKQKTPFYYTGKNGAFVLR